MARRRELWTAQQCADHIGTKRYTWTGYVSRGTAPGAYERDPNTGQRLWDAELVRRWHAGRTGVREVL